MSYKTVLAFLQYPEDEDRLLDVAFPVARSFGAHLTGFHAEPGASAFSTPAYYAQSRMRVQSVDKHRDRMAQMESRFRERAACDDVRSMNGARSRRGDIDTSDAIIASARCADLVIAGQPDKEKHPGAMANVERAIFEGGRPVLFVLWAARIPDSFDRVIVAWNGTREAARAPPSTPCSFLSRPRARWRFFTVDPKGAPTRRPLSQEPWSAAALARHGVNVTIETQLSGGIPAGDIIEKTGSPTPRRTCWSWGLFRARRLSERSVRRRHLHRSETMPCITLMSR
ncbi:MAG: hypothetical protein H6890_07250 [Brucellaceae bacterium]|nr:hypothetical protein [Brucellaceae bacterium]